jgi:NAD-dependent dihydropyrimidine dehydrogenase PreA subunit
MIDLVLESRCTACNRCVEICPTNVFEATPEGPPSIARPDDCQTCFMCELYCEADALYVGPDSERRSPVLEATVIASGLLGQYRRDSGWNEWASDPRLGNQHWRMDSIFARARGRAVALIARGNAGEQTI